MNTPPHRLVILWNRFEVLQQLPLLFDDMRPPVRRVDHSKESHESSNPDTESLIGMVNSVSPVRAEALQLVVVHDLSAGVKPLVADEREEEDSGLAKLEWSVALERIADTMDEGKGCWIEGFKSLNLGRWSQSTQSGLNWLMRVLVVCEN